MKTDLIAQTGRHARAASGGAARVAFVAAAALIPFVLISGAYRSLVASGRFLVHEVAITGNASLPDSEILTLAGLDAPRALWTCRAPAMEAALEASPWVVDAEVHVGGDGVVSIALVEATPAAVTLVDGVPVLVDTTGERLRTATVDDLAALPLVAGLRADSEGAAVSEGDVAEALNIVSTAAARIPQERIVEMHRHDAYGWVAVLASGVEVRLGRGRVDERLARVADALAVARSHGRALTIVYADVEDLRHVAVELAPVAEVAR